MNYQGVACRKSASEIGRRRGCGPIPAGSGHRERRPPPPGQRSSTPQQAPEAPPRRSTEAADRCAPVAVVAAGDRPRPARDRSALASRRLRLFWRRQSRSRKASPLPSETIDLIRDMAARGRLWGAERIRGELLKLGSKVSKRTSRSTCAASAAEGGGGQSWATFLKNHAERMWVCDFIQTHDLLFRQIYAFFLGRHGARARARATCSRSRAASPTSSPRSPTRSSTSS